MQQSGDRRRLEFIPQEHTEFVFMVVRERLALTSVLVILLGAAGLVWWIPRRRRRRFE
jgi:cell division protein FtsW (lipid II flippase)